MPVPPKVVDVAGSLTNRNRLTTLTSVRSDRLSAFLAGCSVALTTPLVSQSRSLEFTYGAWQPDTFAIVWTAGYVAPLLGPFDYGVAVSHIDDRRSIFDRTLTGTEASLGVGRDGSGFYLVSSLGLGVRHRDQALDTHWSAGAGIAARPVPFLSVGIEGRYRAEDQSQRGFWRPAPTDRAGFAFTGRIALLWPGRPPRVTRPRFDPPSAGEVQQRARERGVSADGSVFAADIVATAVDAMGTPYRWGGDDIGGFDCSGLIQFAYGQHGIILPRTGREQVRLGASVEVRVAALNPADILGFAVEGAGGGVSHVGLYLGEGQFIHSASDGVRISSLTATDPDSLWWQRRWVAARRVIR